MVLEPPLVDSPKKDKKWSEMFTFYDTNNDTLLDLTRSKRCAPKYEWVMNDAHTVYNALSVEMD